MRKFGKKTMATIIMLLGAIIFILEVTILSIDGTPGFLLTVCSAVMAIGGATTLWTLNRHRGESVANTVEVGATIIEILLDVFFDL